MDQCKPLAAGITVVAAAGLLLIMPISDKAERLGSSRNIETGGMLPWFGKQGIYHRLAGAYTRSHFY